MGPILNSTITDCDLRFWLLDQFVIIDFQLVQGLNYVQILVLYILD